MINTITRSQLEEVCERVIASPRAALSDDQKNGLRLVAETAPRVSGNSEWWNANSQCGCLVGTMLHGKPSANAVGLRRAGGDYISALFEVGRGADDKGPLNSVLTVIDDQERTV